MRSRVAAPLQKTPASYINWRCKCDVLAPHEMENNKGHPARRTDRQKDRLTDTHEDQPDALPTESNAKYATVFDVRPGTVNTKRTKQETEVSIATKRKRNSDAVYPPRGCSNAPWAGLASWLGRTVVSTPFAPPSWIIITNNHKPE